MKKEKIEIFKILRYICLSVILIFPQRQSLVGFHKHLIT